MRDLCFLFSISRSIFGALQTSSNPFNTDIKRLEGSTLNHIITINGYITSIAVDIYGKTYLT